MKYKGLFLFVLIIIISCKQTTHNSLVNKKLVTFNELIKNLENSNSNEVNVIAHRGDWRNAPENSIQSIQNCIDLGVDMVEIDVKETKDGKLVLMHDETIDRTTNGSGYLKDFTLNSLKTLKLNDHSGLETNYTIPTLEEALRVAKNKILVNLDKSYGIFEKCYEIIEKIGTFDQIIIKGEVSAEELEVDFVRYLDKIHFMPIIRLPNTNGKKIVDDYLQRHDPIAFEFEVPSDTINLISYFGEIRKKGLSIWVNALWPNYNAGHDDEKAITNIEIYDWYIVNNINMIQTDRPKLLLKYLRENGRHK